jgi:hypothetical protein
MDHRRTSINEHMNERRSSSKTPDDEELDQVLINNYNHDMISTDYNTNKGLLN